MARDLIIASFNPEDDAPREVDTNKRNRLVLQATVINPLAQPFKNLHFLEIEVIAGDLLQLLTVLETTVSLEHLSLIVALDFNITPTVRKISLARLRTLELECQPQGAQLLYHIHAPNIQEVHIHAQGPKSIPEIHLPPLYSFVGLLPGSYYTTESATLEFREPSETTLSLTITHLPPPLGSLKSPRVFMAYTEDYMDVGRVCASIPFRGLHLLVVQQDFTPDEAGCTTTNVWYAPDVWIKPFQYSTTITKICMDSVDAIDALTSLLDEDVTLLPALRCLEIRDIDFSVEVCHFVNFTEYLRRRQGLGIALQQLVLHHTKPVPIDNLQATLLSRLVGELLRSP